MEPKHGAYILIAAVVLVLIFAGFQSAGMAKNYTNHICQSLGAEFEMNTFYKEGRCYVIESNNEYIEFTKWAKNE